MMSTYIIDAVRTPVGKRNGVLATARPDDLFAHTIRSLLQRNQLIDPHEIADVICGCAMPEGAQGLNVARIAALLADLPCSVPGLTINRFCASGIESVALAAQRIQLGVADLMIAGGTESMSKIPMMGNKIAMNPKTMEDEYVAIAYGMGLTAEKVAEKYGVSREDQDAFALLSHQRACAAQQTEQFKEEVVPYTIHHTQLENGTPTPQTNIVDIDQGPRPDSSLETLQRLKTVFAQSGSVTAGNSSQMSDGAGAVLLASEHAVKRLNLIPKARFIGYAVAGVLPELMGIGPVEAVPKLLKQTNYRLQQIDWIELNEAFAAQSLAVIRSLDLDTEIVNPLGGAIALGHPLGATGSIRMATLTSAMQRKKAKLGLVTMCVGTGMGAAALFESCS